MSGLLAGLGVGLNVSSLRIFCRISPRCCSVVFLPRAVLVQAVLTAACAGGMG